jgi:hypothetical protein
MKRFSVNRATLAALALIITVAGCISGKPTPKPGVAYTYVIKLDPNSIKPEDGPIKVDVLKINSSSKAQFENVPIDDYFLPDSRYRSSAPKIQQFNLTLDNPVTIDLNLPENQSVRSPGYTYIAILADSPCGDCATQKEGDPRRKFIPLDTESWQGVKWPDKPRQINITVTKSLGIFCDPAWTPEPGR